MWRLSGGSRKAQCSETGRLLSGYVDQRLSPRELARVEEHLETCQQCREELESLRATVAVLRGLPEMSPSRSFAVAPVGQLPVRRVLPALRFVTAAAVLLLGVVFAVDLTDVAEKRQETANYGIDTLSTGDKVYWTVGGVRNSVGTDSETSVTLVLPGDTDNACAAVESLSADGVLYGNVRGESWGPTEVVLEDSAGGEVEEFVVVSESSMRLVPNGEVAASAFSPIIEHQEGSYLNMVPVSSDNGVLYSFNLDDAERVAAVASDNDWLHALEYGLMGLAAVLGAATVGLWLRQNRERMAEARRPHV